MTCQDDALKATDQVWRGSKEIWQRADNWSKTGIRHALVKLASNSFVEVRSVPWRAGGIRFEYRLPQRAVD